MVTGSSDAARHLSTQGEPPPSPRHPQTQLTVLQAVGAAVAQVSSLDELFRTLYRELARALDVTGFILALYDEASQTIEVVRQVESGVELPGGVFPLGGGFTSQVIRTGQPRLIRRWSSEGPRVQIQYATGRPGLPESGVTVPLVYARRVIGVLSVQSYRAEAYDEADLALLMAIAGPAALAIEHLRRSHRFDEQLQQQVSELEAILSSMADALLIVDAEGRVVRLNQAARALLCVEDTSIILGHPLDREQWGQWPLGAREVAEALGPVLEALRRGEVYRDVEVQVRERGRRVLSFSCAPIRDARGVLSGGVIAVRDVTGRREIELLKDEMLSMASHDLRTPVAAIKALAQRLERHALAGQLDAQAVAESARRIARQVDQFIALLDRLLDLSCIEAGRLTLHPQPCDLVALARRVLDALQPTTERHELRLIAPPAVEGVWDGPRLEQVLQNLLANAIKYSPDGGIVEVTIGYANGQVQLCVRDEGAGLPPDELERVFERFYRAGRTSRLTGAGLGLYICRGIIAAHGGRIWAESAGPGCGSRFCLVLPVRPPGSDTP